MIRRGQRGLEEGGLLLEADRDQRGHERALAGEVLVDHGGTAPEAISQPPHRERVQPLVLQELAGCCYDLPRPGTEPIHHGGGNSLAGGIPLPALTVGLAWSS